MKSGEKDGRTATGLSLIVKELAVRLKWEGKKGERESRRSHAGVGHGTGGLYPTGQAEWQQGLVRQTLVGRLRHVVTARCGSHHPYTNSDWPQPGWQNVGFSACLE